MLYRVHFGHQLIDIRFFPNRYPRTDLYLSWKLFALNELVDLWPTQANLDWQVIHADESLSEVWNVVRFKTTRTASQMWLLLWWTKIKRDICRCVCYTVYASIVTGTLQFKPYLRHFLGVLIAWSEAAACKLNGSYSIFSSAHGIPNFKTSHLCSKGKVICDSLWFSD